MNTTPFPAPRVAASRVIRHGALPALIGGVCVFFVAGRLAELEFREVVRAAGAVSPLQWLLAFLATTASFAAVGQYDALFHRWLRTGVAEPRAATSGATAIALSQTLGFGLATGTLARWRALPELTFGAALKVTNYVSFSFMAALGLLGAVAIAAGGAGTDLSLPFGLGATAAAFGTLIASLAWTDRLPFRLPPARLMLRLLLLAALDTACAALALAALVPAGLLPEPMTFFAAFLLALGAGLLSGAPGGVGPFELCLISFLPTVPEPELVAAILAFRLIYYAIPACVALILLANPVASRVQRTAAPEPRIRPARAEAGLARLDTHHLIPAGGNALVVAKASQTLVAIGDTVENSALCAAHLEALAAEARNRHLWPAVYKCGARSATNARRLGWSVVPVAREAWLDARGFDLDGSGRRQLRRKLRSAAKSGVTIAHAASLPLAGMARVAREWAERSGGERGFSMGRFDPAYLESQRCYLAWKDGRIAAFASFHAAPGEWTLDLMRSANQAPDGTMHALVTHAILDAKSAGVARLSLAAMPLACPPAALAPIARRREARGLVQFKTSFAPRTSPLYVAAPGPGILALAGLDILMRIRFPATAKYLRTADSPDSSNCSVSAIKMHGECR